MTASTQNHTSLRCAALCLGVAAVLAACSSQGSSRNQTANSTLATDPQQLEKVDPLWPGPSAQTKALLAGDAQVISKVQSLILRAQIKEALHVLSIIGGGEANAESIEAAHLLFMVPSPDNAVEVSSEGNFVVVSSPSLLTPVKVDVASESGAWVQTGANQNYQSGTDLRLDRNESWKTGVISEAVAANGLMWESNQLEERRAWAFLAAVRLVLVSYASSHGRLPASLQDALAELQLSLTPAASSPPLLPISIQVNETGTAVLFLVETPIGATYSETCVLKPGMSADSFALKTAALDDFERTAPPVFSSTIFSTATVAPAE